MAPRSDFVTLTAEQKALVADCRDTVRYPGKFEGQPAYVVHFWHCYLDGCADSDDGKVLRFKVDDTDRAMFPELYRRHWVRLVETEQGFVEEV